MKLSNLLILILGVIIALSILYYPISIMKDGIDYCEENNWDGSKYSFSNLSINSFGKESGITCIKTKETDSIVKLVNSMFFWRYVK